MLMDKNLTGSLSIQHSGDETTHDRGKQSGDETPQNQGISNKLSDRSRLMGGNQSKSAWGNTMAKLQETARQLGMEMARHDPTRRNLNFDNEEEDSTIN
jgi:hypothetical protein